MPTIDQLPPAQSVGDRDELAISQNGDTLRATRAQILAGVQPALAVPGGSLLGRLSAGVGAPEVIGIGANLTIANNNLIAPAPFNITGLPQAAYPQPADQVPIGQGGNNSAVTYDTFFSGLHNIPGISASNLVVTPRGAPGPRPLTEITADAISIASFGAIGDGITDDTSAFSAALASGRSIWLDSRIYIVNGAVSVMSTPALFGVPGGTIIRRLASLGGGPWITVSCPALSVFGVAFDGNSLLANDASLVCVTSACLATIFRDCAFHNSAGPQHGNGLELDMAPGSQHSVVHCGFQSNAQNGCLATGPGQLSIRNCGASNNGAAGVSVSICETYSIDSCVCSSNQIGISTGSWNGQEMNSPLSYSSIVSNNSCSGNASWGFALQGSALVIYGNAALSNGSNIAGGGYLCRLATSILNTNSVNGGGAGFDARGCLSTMLKDNLITGCSTAIMLGGAQNCIVRANYVTGNGWGISITAIEPAISFALTGPLTIDSNWITISEPLGGGIHVLDGATGISIVNNDCNVIGSADVSQCLWLHTDTAIVSGNRWNNQSQVTIQAGTVAGVPSLVIPDIADEGLVTAAGEAISSVVTAHQASTIGQITFIRVTTAGSGYTQAQVGITGTGNGAAAQAIVSNGQVLWIIVTNPGSGYGPIGSAAVVTITGDGAGAQATAFVGLPPPSGRRVRLSCNLELQFSVGSAIPPIMTWTGGFFTVPAFGAIDLEGAFGGWRLAAGPSVDYVVPSGSGSVTLQSATGGSLTLRPSAGGALYIANAGEPVGCSSNVGRGAPTGQVSAPPGSDYRNLDGGPGNTFWIKQSSGDGSGWVAVA